MTMGGHSDLSLQQARRIAVAAQGLSGPRSPARSGRAKILQVYQQIAQTQIDSVNVVARAHYQPVFARLGDYSRTQLDRLVAGAASPVTEYWSHEASYVRSDLVGDLRRWRPRHWADASHRFTPEQHRLVAPVLEFLDSNPAPRPAKSARPWTSRPRRTRTTGDGTGTTRNWSPNHCSGKPGFSRWGATSTLNGASPRPAPSSRHSTWSQPIRRRNHCDAWCSPP